MSTLVHGSRRTRTPRSRRSPRRSWRPRGRGRCGSPIGTTPHTRCSTRSTRRAPRASVLSAPTPQTTRSRHSRRVISRQTPAPDGRRQALSSSDGRLCSRRRHPGQTDVKVLAASDYERSGGRNSGCPLDSAPDLALPRAPCPRRETRVSTILTPDRRPATPPKTLDQIFAYYTTRYAAAGVFEVAVANYATHKTKMGILGSRFASRECRTQEWAPPPIPQAVAAAGGGGSGGGSGAGAGSVCSFEVIRMHGVIISSRLLFCRTL